MRDCASCGKPIQTANKRAVYCSQTCKRRAFKARANGVPVLRPEASPPAPVAGAVFNATLSELEAVGRTGTALGAKALALAARIDAGADTGSAIAAMVRQHDLTMAEAVRGASVAASPLDELRRRRDAKLNAG